MGKKTLTIKSETAKHLIEIEEGKQYLIVFGNEAGLVKDKMNPLGASLSENFNAVIRCLLIQDINSMKVVQIEENKI